MPHRYTNVVQFILYAVLPKCDCKVVHKENQQLHVGREQFALSSSYRSNRSRLDHVRWWCLNNQLFSRPPARTSQRTLSPTQSPVQCLFLLLRFSADFSGSSDRNISAHSFQQEPRDRHNGAKSRFPTAYKPSTYPSLQLIPFLYIFSFLPYFLLPSFLSSFSLRLFAL